MDRWSGILKVPLCPNSKAHYRVAASLCLSSSSKTLIIPSANAIFFNGDRVEGTGNPVIERLSDLQRIAEILGLYSICKQMGRSKIIQPNWISSFYINSLSLVELPQRVIFQALVCHFQANIVQRYEPLSLKAKNFISRRQEEPYQAGVSASCSHQPRTFILGFSKGGTVLNQLVTELGLSALKSSEYTADGNKQLVKGVLVNIQEENQIIPSSKESLLNNITEIHYVDVGLNSTGAYLTDGDIIERISKRLLQAAAGIRFVLHGTPRQWCDSRRVWIKNEKEKLLQLLKLEAQKSGGKLHVCERFYFADKPPSLQMHFEIIESLDVS